MSEISMDSVRDELVAFVASRRACRRALFVAKATVQTIFKDPRHRIHLIRPSIRAAHTIAEASNSSVSFPSQGAPKLPILETIDCYRLTLPPLGK